MKIFVKYNLNDVWEKYNLFDEISNYEQVCWLWCNMDQLTRLPETLPNSLTDLNYSNNQLTRLPENLPNSLTKLCGFRNPFIKKRQL